MPKRSPYKTEQAIIGRQIRSSYPFVSGSKKDQIQDKQIESVKRKVQVLNKKFELVHHDELLSNVSTTTGVFTLLNGMAVGDTNILRTGNDMNSTSIQWRLRLVGDVDSITGWYLRHLIVFDSQSNGGTPAIGDVLDVSVITTAVIAPYNRDNQKRFKIIEDKSFIMNPTLATSGTTPITAVASNRQHHSGKRQLSRPVKYIGTGATIASIGTNALWSIILSDANTDAPVFQCGYRYYAKDA